MIRNLQPTDREAYSDLKFKCFGYRAVPEFTEFSCQRTFAWIEDNKVVGFCKWIPMGNIFNRHAVIGTLMVDPDYRSRGIGRALVAATVTHALGYYKHIELRDMSEFKQSSKIAKALGFVEKHRREWWI